ncbi:hypothetical protein K1T71_010153 [Dendrolimus kikuchii]|uniref:Uncharacterized protein n=1 Tax=Dendrolimus kikuchii TaxID=765133 RepID=A0ACC1CRV6_9NEOP|nr:hypothetical protein K1T71_010153 [Dendrolimus kikuchii]
MYCFQISSSSTPRKNFKMKFLVAFAFIAAVASASYLQPIAVSEEMAQIQEVIAAIQSPSTDPATAAALEAMLQDLFGINAEPISVGPAIIDFPLPDGGAVTAEEPIVNPVPVIVGPAVSSESSPLVQIIVNVNAASSGAAASPAPAVVPQEQPQPIIVVDEAQNIEEIVPLPVIVVESAEPESIEVEPVQVAEPVIVEPVIIGTPIIPAPAVVLPEELN